MLRVCVLMLAVAGACPAQQRNPFANNSQAAENGRNTFRIFCSSCHGIAGGGGRGPDLTRGTFSAGDTDRDLFRVISDGVSGTEMSSYSYLEDDNIWQLVAYIRSIARKNVEQAAGNAAAGEKLFWTKGACGQCHTVGVRGGRLGPDLTYAGRRRALAYLRQAIVAPHDDISPGYATISVVTRDGKTIRGVQRGYDNFSAQLTDLQERFYSFQKSEVTSLKREFRSLMPDNYGKLFTPAELNDLIAYLASLRGPEGK